jgi:hypothetical protein
MYHHERSCSSKECNKESGGVEPRSPLREHAAYKAAPSTGLTLSMIDLDNVW